MKQAYNRGHVLLIYVILVLATIVAYEPVRHNGFVNYDDYEYVTENPQVKSGINRQSIIWAFTSSQSANWFPLTWLSHMLDCELFDVNPFWHHLTSLLLHISNTLLLFWVFKRMTGAVWQSAFVAAAFALHPLHVESVAWASERKDVLSGLFWMLTIAAYIRYAEQPRIGRYLLVVLALCLGLMSKPMVVTLPFVLLLLDYWPLGRFQWGRRGGEEALRQSELVEVTHRQVGVYHLIIEKIPLFILVAVLSAITFRFQQIAGAVMQENLPFDFRIANALISYAKYIVKMIYPSRMAVFYPIPVGDLPEWQTIVSFIIVVCISMGVVYTAQRHRYLAVGWLWYLGTLVPVIGLVQVGGQAMADRYSYLPSIGIFIMIAWGVAELLANLLRQPAATHLGECASTARWHYQKIAIGITVGVAIVILLICTRRQVSYWQNSFTLFGHTLAVTEDNYITHKNYGNVLYRDGQLDEAVKHYKEALRITPFYLTSRLNLGLVFIKQKKFDEAIECFDKVLQIKPEDSDAHFYLALAILEQGKSNGVVEHFNEALKIRPQWPDVYYNLGVFYARQGNYELAIKNYTQVLQLSPGWLDAMNNLARLLATAGDTRFQNPAEAIRLAERACELTKYEQPELLNTLAVAYASAGQFSWAIEIAEKAIKLAEQAGQKELADEIQNRLQLYKAGQPYRD